MVDVFLNEHFSMVFFYQTFPPDYDMKAKLNEILESNGFEKKRPRMMDIDEFLE